MKKDLKYKYPVRSAIKEHALVKLAVYSDQGLRRSLKEIGHALGRAGLWRNGKLADDSVKTRDAMIAFVLDCQLEMIEGYPKLRVGCEITTSPIAEKFVAHFLGEDISIQVRARAWTTRMERSSPVWSNAPWFLKSPYAALHFLHNATQVPGNVAYAENPGKLLADRFTSTRPGRYLTRFFSDVLSEQEIKSLAEAQDAMYGTGGDAVALKFIESTDKAGWVDIYERGPESCMRGEGCVEVYAHEKSVLRLAYLESLGEITARAIVREDTKQYVRCYPNTNSDENQRWHTRMQIALEQAGYTHGNLNGVWLDKVGNRGDEGGWLMPYLDYGKNGDQRVEENSEGYWVVGSRGFDATSQSGYIFGEEMRTCDNCGGDFPEDEVEYIDHSDECVCARCLDGNFVFAYGRRGSTYYVRVNDAVCVGGEWYDSEYLSDNDIGYCEYEEGYYHWDNLVLTMQGAVNDGDAVSLSVADSEGNDYAYPGHTVTTWDGRTIHRDDADEREVNGETRVCHCDDPQEDETEEAGEIKEVV